MNILRPSVVPSGLVFNPFGIPRQVEPMAHNIAMNDYVMHQLGESSGPSVGGLVVFGAILLGVGAVVIALSRRRRS